MLQNLYEALGGGGEGRTWPQEESMAWPAAALHRARPGVPCQPWQEDNEGQLSTRPSGVQVGRAAGVLHCGPLAATCSRKRLEEALHSRIGAKVEAQGQRQLLKGLGLCFSPSVALSSLLCHCAGNSEGDRNEGAQI